MEEGLRLEGTGGLMLEAQLGLVEGARGGLVLCHPHPLYGGDMDNPVVVRVAEAAREAGVSTLRFNFRGVGGSAGSYDHGEGEGDDIRAGLLALRARLPAGGPLALAGYSFGAWVAARVAATDSGLAALALIAPPMAMFDFGGLGGAPKHVLLVAGTRDSYCSVGDIERLASRLTGTRTVIVEGADHFFFGKLFPLGEAVRAWVGRWAVG